MSPAGCSRRWGGWTAEGRNSHAEIPAALCPPDRSVRRTAGGGLRRRAGPPGGGVLPGGNPSRGPRGRRRGGAHLGVHLRLSPVLAQHLSCRRAGGGRNPLFLLRPGAELDHGAGRGCAGALSRPEFPGYCAGQSLHRAAGAVGGALRPDLSPARRRDLYRTQWSHQY